MAGVYSVAQVNSYIKNMFAQDFLLRRLSVKGEVSNCKYHSSGHIYFTLKDGGGTLQAVMFASQRRGLNFKLAEGQQVVVKGTVDVYERDGKYQLYASEIELSGGMRRIRRAASAAVFVLRCASGKRRSWQPRRGNRPVPSPQAEVARNRGLRNG